MVATHLVTLILCSVVHFSLLASSSTPSPVHPRCHALPGSHCYALRSLVPWGELIVDITGARNLSASGTRQENDDFAAISFASVLSTYRRPNR